MPTRSGIATATVMALLIGAAVAPPSQAQTFALFESGQVRPLALSPDKKTLFVELVDSLGSRLRRHLAEKVAGASKRLDKERLGLEAFLDFVTEHRHLYRIVRQADFVDQACFRRYYRTMADGYARGLREAIDGREIRRADPEVLAYCLMGVADFLGMRWVLWEKKPRRDVVADALAFIEGGLTAPAPRRRR